MPLVNGKFLPIELPEKHFRVLNDTTPARFRVLYGGRNGAKDWSFDNKAIELAIRKPLRFLFTREVQESIKASAYQLIKDTIKRNGLSDYFDITREEIRCKINESIFIFHGLNDLVSANLKSFEGIDIAVIGEAENLTEKSLRDLDATVRKPGSEIWIEFNTQAADDFVYKFCVTDPPENMLCELVTYLDLPKHWVSQETLEQAERMRVKDPAEYLHYWLGQPSKTGSRVWPTFEQKVHVREFDFEDIANRGNLYMGMDPHTVYYPFAVWMAKIPKGGGEFYRVVYNEFPFATMFDGKLYHEIRDTKPCTLTLKQLSIMFQVLDTTMGGQRIDATMMGRSIDTRFAKASGAKSWATKTEGVVTEFSRPENGGLQFRCPAETQIDAQRDNLRKLMNYNDDFPISAINEPLFYVMPHCHNVIASLSMHRFEPGKQKESDKYKDPSDAIKIALALMENDVYVDPLRTEERPAERFDQLMERVDRMPVHEAAMA